MKTLQYLGAFDEAVLRQQLFEEFPEWRVVAGYQVVEYLGIYYNETTNILTLYVPDAADEGRIQIVIDNHDPSASTVPNTVWADVVKARQDFLNLPSWASWTAQEAEDFIHGDVLNAMGKAELEAWININVTTLATAKTALILLGQELIDLREICEAMAKAIVLLREIAVERG